MLKHGYGTSFKKAIIRMGKTDLRFGIDKLAALVNLEYGFDPMETGTIYLFCGSRLDRIKALMYEEDGYILLTKRLTDGSFQWPRSSDEARELTEDDFDRLMSGFTIEPSIKTTEGADGESSVKMTDDNGISHEAEMFFGTASFDFENPEDEELLKYIAGDSELINSIYAMA